MDYSVITKFINQRFKKISIMNSNYYNEISRWLSWYKGYDNTFHTEKINNGITQTQRDVYCLRMGKRVCEDWASALLSEDIQITVSSSNKRSSIFVMGSVGNGGVLGSNNFNEVFSRCIEQMFALGTSAFVLNLDNIGVDANGNIVRTAETSIKIDGYNATCIIPISWHNGIIKEAAFASEYKENDRTYYIVSSHIKEQDGYVIYNDIVDAYGKTSRLNINLLPVIRTKSLKPLFYIVKTNIANNIDLDSPMGISVYANALEVLKGCDVVYDSCLREVITGQRIIPMVKSMLAKTPEGLPIVPQDSRQPYMIYLGGDILPDISNFIQEFHPSLNSAVLDGEMQAQLNILSMRVGLGAHYYNFNRVGGITATEYAGERNDFMRNSAKMSKSVGECIKNMVLGILFLGKTVLCANVDDNAKVEVKVPDGIVESDDSKREQDRKDMELGVISKAEYRAKWYRESLETAEKKIQSIAGVSYIREPKTVTAVPLDKVS